MWGAAVFQVHIPGSKNRYEEAHFKSAIADAERTIASGLSKHSRLNSGYAFALHPLQSKNEGYTARELDFDGEEYAWGQDGHATRYYAVLIKSRIARPRAPKTISELKAYMYG